jgi:hypothetical protein
MRKGWDRFIEHQSAALSRRCHDVRATRDRLDRAGLAVLEYRSLAGRPVRPARDRCDNSQIWIDPLTAARDPRRAHRSADLAEAPPLRRTRP